MVERETGSRGSWKAKIKAVVYKFDEDKFEKLLKDNSTGKSYRKFKTHQCAID